MYDDDDDVVVKIYIALSYRLSLSADLKLLDTTSIHDVPSSHSKKAVRTRFLCRANVNRVVFPRESFVFIPSPRGKSQKPDRNDEGS